ncbi:hypothetical protein A3K29_05560 [Candidatus Collierbacteria bacterium RIFOXYB2_FULL_46_14]|uniref:Uncharacterized protein n=1 Tax=Candidatus Collierbacteria bacterium GW2011_GWA2_46_26 TaxID=1618381 RepID=A0A0G1PKL3_9BACT|nr:MAG: hypothetical protein UX47_C0004G0004 [Candidatus Collierbacteria bacterium GW2011_GWA2_46_26]OGD73556.1 MAG: hypothetical protein A3K29_05560 [Candidatus Collierbacteria bacterium RIFOXYB2_FULL_46_14]OGD76598.1 MAG: hypothetical protein A3K43_05560 [Candidatus Collierbacteria bacterium RIFOXYA2_FULL_46_20]OGD77934.1 MAG: hypothetical protein A3K39_05560 [Candidatus Collierbacteria bacterium RIFOXYC2_FULL_43_15]OGD81225.1 MAG: hypothetical protein A2320_06060 [Pseudomonadales bacterium G
MSKNSLNVRDIISSPEFAFGRHDYDREDCDPAIMVGGTDKDHIVSESYDDEERVAYAAKTGKILPRWHDVNYGAYDETRGTARFVIERAEMEGGSTGGGMSGHDDYPDALHVTARRLFQNGDYNPEGELIKFTYDTNCYINSIDHVTVHGQMKLIFTK